ncbi:hypothetical protein Ae168Ps1_6201c [Pseudonocardia sp. Ae168_Ps1]|nr:hypothetical protein Ae168Ps1_6201c [Pseudonocardia sp. Ae168_Ps1]OLL71573.1 hypothetical protein Ae263Ps1_6061c [Pseudonocardia sp. Ae263_Ps1]
MLQRDPDMRHRAVRGDANPFENVHVPAPRAAQDPPTVPRLVWVQPAAIPPDLDRVGPVIRGRDGIAYGRVCTLIVLMTVLAAVVGFVLLQLMPGAA